MFRTPFLVAALERALKSAAQVFLVALGTSDTGPANLFELNVANSAGFAASGFAISFLTSIISYGVSPGGSPSLTPKAEVDSTFAKP